MVIKVKKNTETVFENEEDLLEKARIKQFKKYDVTNPRTTEFLYKNYSCCIFCGNNSFEDIGLDIHENLYGVCTECGKKIYLTVFVW